MLITTIDSNSNLSAEIDTKNSILTELRDTNNAIKTENIALIEKASKLEEKVQLLGDKIEEYYKENEQLKKRQIDPELAMQIRQTQSMIQESVRYDRSPTTYDKSYERQSSLKDEIVASSKQLYDLSELLNNADILINRISELVGRFESYQSRGTYDNGANIISQFEQDLYTLLESTSRMSFQLQMLTAEIRKSYRNSNESITFNQDARSKIFSSTPITRADNDNRGSSQWGDTFSTVGLGATTAGSSPEDREFMQPVKNSVFNDIVYPPSSVTKITPISIDVSNNLSQTYPYASPKYGSSMQPRLMKESPPANNHSFYDKSPKVSINTSNSIPRRAPSNKLEMDLKILSKKLDSLNSTNFM